MRILEVHSGSDFYGASRSFLRLASRLVRDGHEVTCVLPYPGPLVAALENAQVRTLIYSDLPVLTRRGMRSIRGLATFFPRLLTSIRRLRRLITALGIELVHSNTAVLLSPGIAARISGVPHVWHVRESFEEFGLLWRPYEFLMRLFSTVIVCVSGPIAEQFSSHNGVRVEVIHNGFPRDEFAPVEDERVTSFRATYGVVGNRLVGIVGRIKFWRKGQDIFAMAASRLNSQFSDVKFLFIGSPFPGNEEHLVKLKQLAKKLKIEDQVVYTGDVEDMGAAYSSLEISVLASCQPEPFGGVVVESMAYEKPVIGTNIGGTKEQIDHEVTGLLVPPGDEEALARAIERLLANPQIGREMGRRGRERYLRMFEFEPFYKKICLLYRSAIDDNQRKTS